MKLILILFLIGLIFGYLDDRKAKKEQKNWRNSKK
jgi:preprotein translocase subunit SecG